MEGGGGQGRVCGLKGQAVEVGVRNQGLVCPKCYDLRIVLSPKLSSMINPKGVADRHRPK